MTHFIAFGVGNDFFLNSYPISVDFNNAIWDAQWDAHAKEDEKKDKQLKPERLLGFGNWWGIISETVTGVRIHKACQGPGKQVG